MRRKTVRVFVFALGFISVAAAAFIGRALFVLERSYAEVPLPALVADSSPEAVQRGEMLFNSLCMECHGGADGRATGKHLDEMPPFLGVAWSANLAHPKKGVHQRTDGELARVLRTGVLPDGRLSALMSGFAKLGDADVAAILGYMRSRPPVFEPSGDEQPRTQISLVGKLILTYVAKVSVSPSATVIPVPKKAPTVEYGRYMAEALDCVGCHTAGFGSDKMADENAFAGGMELMDPTGTPIFSRNITSDVETGIGAWSEADFGRALTRGVRPEGTLVRKPMPLFSRLDDTDVAALYAFLRSIPAVHRPNTPGGHPLQRASPGDSAEELFVKVGCAACHGASAPYREKLLGALEKSDEDVTGWILNPQRTKPGSIMPSFEGALDRSQAELLAKYVKETAAKKNAAPANAN